MTWAIKVSEKTLYPRMRWKPHAIVRTEPTLDELNILRAKHGAVHCTRLNAAGEVVEVICMMRQSAYRQRFTGMQP